MTNKEANIISIHCQLLAESTQIKFKTARQLLKNAKVATELSKEVSELVAVANKKELTLEETTKEIFIFENENYKGTEFEKVEIEDIDTISFEELKIEEDIKSSISKVVFFLSEQGIIES